MQNQIILMDFEPIFISCVIDVRKIKWSDMKKTLLLTLLMLLSGIIFSQSLSGNLNSEATKESLGYGNVDVYKNNKLV